MIEQAGGKSSSLHERVSLALNLIWVYGIFAWVGAFVIYLSVLARVPAFVVTIIFSHLGLLAALWLGCLILLVVWLHSRQELFYQRAGLFSTRHLVYSLVIFGLFVWMFADSLFRISSLNSIRARNYLTAIFIPHEAWILVVILLIFCSSLAGWIFGHTHGKWSLLFRFGTVASFTFLLYILSTTSMAAKNPNQAYFPDLAGSFLQGKLYLENPSSVIDLTLYHDHLYMAFPPLAALLVLPQVALQGVQSIDPLVFSVFWASLNVGLVYLMLELFSRRRWSTLDSLDNLWLTALFAFGTENFILGTQGDIWYVNHILSVAFALLAVVLLLLSESPVMSSAGLGLAMLARPNIVFLWPFLWGLHLQMGRERGGSFNVRRELKWVARSALPLLAGAGLLLFYNWLRFGNWLDFGYGNMNLSYDIKTFGQFNLHFIPYNLYSLFLAPPEWNKACGFFAPNLLGMSLFLTTPALITLFAAWRKTIWVYFSWLSIGLLLVPLLLYFNNGALQFGYRFSMDFIIPGMALMTVRRRGRLEPWLFGLILASIVVCYMGRWWYFGHLCR
jgi:hypothetical protein